MTWDVAYTVIALAVFTVGWVIAYARGYSAGHDAGYVEAVGDFSDGQWADAVRDKQRKQRRG